MWTDGNGFFYEGDMREGDREATPEELSACAVRRTKNSIYADIALLETKITNRRLREALITGDHSFIQSVETQIIALRLQLQG